MVVNSKLLEEDGDNAEDDPHEMSFSMLWFPTLCIVLLCIGMVIFAEAYLSHMNFDLIGIMINFIGGVCANSIMWLIPIILYMINYNNYSSKWYSLLSISFFVTFCGVFISWILSF